MASSAISLKYGALEGGRGRDHAWVTGAVTRGRGAIGLGRSPGGDQGCQDRCSNNFRERTTIVELLAYDNTFPVGGAAAAGLWVYSESAVSMSERRSIAVETGACQQGFGAPGNAHIRRGDNPGRAGGRRVNLEGMDMVELG